MELGCNKLGLILEAIARTLKLDELVRVVLEPVVQGGALQMLAKAELATKISEGSCHRNGAVGDVPHMLSQPGPGGPVGAECFAFGEGNFSTDVLDKINGKISSLYQQLFVLVPLGF